MANPREAVVEDVVFRLLDEHGVEVGVLDWKILEDVATAIPSDRHDVAIERSRDRHRKLKSLIDGKVGLDDPAHKTLVHGSLKKRARAEQRNIKRHRRAKSKAKKQGWEPHPIAPELRTKLDGVSLGKDKNGFFVRTHRARCKSYPTPGTIPKAKIAFIKSTG